MLYEVITCAVPVEAMYRDIEIIKSLGANCVRTCHYPNDERFLDLCDENGIVVWEEAHARGLNETQMKHKNFDLQSAACIQEMIENHYNHPSIFVWGIFRITSYNVCYTKLLRLFLHAAAVRERWNGPEDLPVARVDLSVAILLGGVVSMAVVVTSAAALGGSGAGISSAGDMAAQLEPLLGAWARVRNNFV